MYEAFAGRQVLLLQGPVGPFFRRLAADLEDYGATVTKVNLNVADSLFYLGKPSVSFRGRPACWPDFLERLLEEREIEVLMLFGDGRPFHRQACEVASRAGVPVFVFEEGYLRPDHITMEPEGVNGRSTMPRNPALYRDWDPSELAPTESVGNTFPYFAFYSFVNSVACTFFAWLYPYYRHHRDVNAFRQLYYWSRSAWRYIHYRRSESHLLDELTERASKRFFLLPLQVHNDSQWQHADFADSEALIRFVCQSFAMSAEPDHRLVIKHHPLDRGYRDYSDLVRELAQQHSLDNRLLYVHDLHLPLLLQHARGTVVMNSTVGLSSIYHDTPVKVLGRAVYDLPGLTCQESLDQFWSNPGHIDRRLHHDFQGWLRTHNQANGSFYRPLAGSGNHAQVRWFCRPPALG
jgi:capsular polysaccharide export protein